MFARLRSDGLRCPIAVGWEARGGGPRADGTRRGGARRGEPERSEPERAEPDGAKGGGEDERTTGLVAGGLLG